MTREEKLQKAHQMFDNRNLLTELKWQREYFKRGYVSNQEELFNLWIFDKCIKALEQEPKTGHWISTETKGVRYAFWCRYKCSLCGGLSDRTNFCPNCGARMVEPQESEDKE